MALNLPPSSYDQWRLNIARPHRFHSLNPHLSALNPGFSMINPFKEINWKPDVAELRKFAWSLVIGFPSIALVFFLVKTLKTHALPEAGGFLLLAGTGASVGLVCLAVPVIARPLYHVWYGLAACVGIVMVNLLFAVMFYGLFAPIGMLMRLMGRDHLKLRWKKDQSSYWRDAAPMPPARNYFSQY
jgi:hypothetical protein